MKPNSQKPDYWFPVKRYGIGWDMPVRWQGWVFIVLWFVIFLLGMYFIIPMESELWAVAFVTFFVGMIGICMAVGWWKGQKPCRWRWGEEDESSLCENCGYNLTGNTSGTCPECGTTVPTPMPSQAERKPKSAARQNGAPRWSLRAADRQEDQ